MHLHKMNSIGNLGQAIKKRRALLGITQAALAQISGTSLRSLKALEKGTANPTWEQITKVLQALGWSLELKERKQ
jgi:predicted transcriptional regulator